MYVGPYEVAQKLGKGSYHLKNTTTGRIIKKKVNACRLLPRKHEKNVSFCEDCLFQFGTPSLERIQVYQMRYKKQQLLKL